VYKLLPVLKRDDQEPLFLQLYSQIKNEIVNGNLKRNDKLPSKRQLANSLQCSQNTIQAAYNQLVDEGYLVSRPKSGFYVAEIDGILNIQGAAPVSTEAKIQKSDVIFDFSYQGVDLSHFPFATWRRITKNVINESDKELLQVCDPQGYLKLRSVIARYLKHSRGVSCSSEQIIISSGTEFLIQLLIQLFDKKFVYAIESPGYEKLPMIFKSSRAEFRSITLDKFGVNPDELVSKEANIACITPSHQFPSGIIMPISRRIELLNWANEQPDRYIIEDDYDSEFRYSGKPIPSLQGLDENGKVIYISAFSKSLSPGLRISYMVLPEKLLEIYRKDLNFYICPVPTIEQKVLQRFMDDGHFERHLNRMRNLYKQKREKLVLAARNKLAGISIEGATAGLHLVLNVNIGLCENELIQKAEEHGIKVYGMSRFLPDKTPGSHACKIIIGFATLDIVDIDEAVSRLGKAWEK
jgi:GntR family transcriptional regulator/MocR family aminotransferase